MMEEKGLDFTKPVLDLSPPVDRSVPRCCLMRQIGYLQKKTHIPNELRWAAEDSMINKEKHDEFKCHLPDFSRSTFLMVFSPDGKKVASTHGNHNVYVTDLTSGKNVQTLTGHPRTPWCIAFHPSSNQILASGCLGGQVRVWDLHGGSEIWTADSNTVIASLAFHPIDKMLVIASYNELLFWDWSKSEPFAKCYTSNEKEKVRYVAFDHLGDKLITGVTNAPVRVASQWDRVSVPQPPPSVSSLDAERRITICYRYMVEQYEHLIQHYFDRARARATMDRGTDPMDVEAESSHSSASTSIPSTSNTQQASVSSRSSSRLFDCLRRRPNTSQTTASNTVEADSNRNTQNSPFPNPNRTDHFHSSQTTTQSPCTPEERNRARQGTDRVSAGTDATSASRSSSRISDETIETYANLVSELTQPGFSAESLTYLGRAHRALAHLQQTLSSRSFNLSNSEASSNRRRISPTRNTHSVRGHPSFSNVHLRPSEINPRNNSDLPHPPSFNSRSRDASSASSNNVSRDQTMNRHLIDSPPLDRPLSGLSPETIGFGIGNQATEAANSSPNTMVQLGVDRIRQLTEDFLGRRRNNLSDDSTDMNPIDSDNEHREESPITRMAEEVSLDSIMYSFRRSSSSGELSRTNLGSPNVEHWQPFTPNIDTATPTAASRIRNPPRRLQTANRTPSHHSPHIMSAEYEASERRLLNRLNEILERPLEPRPRRFFVSRRSAFQPRPSLTANNPRPNTTNSSTSTSPELDRNRLEIFERYRLDRAHLGLQQVRRILEDLQSQIYALHGVVRSRNISRPESAPESGSRSETEATPRRHRSSGHDVAADVLTDEDSDGAVNDNRQWRSSGGYRRLHVRLCRRYNKFVSQNPRPFAKRPRSCVNKPKDGPSRLSQLQSHQNNRRPVSTGTSSSQQATTSEEFLSERGEASSSHVSGETSTGTGTSEELPSVRGVKRKSKDSEPLFRPRPSASGGSGPSTSSQQPSNIVSSMRDTIMQLESMIWRARTRTAQRNIRLSRFTRQREERMMRNLWDTESSHESSREDQSEGDSSQPSGNGEPFGESDWARLRQESTRLRARQVLLLMVNSLTQFFQNDNLSQRNSNEALHEHLFVLLQLALNLTDLLLAQLSTTRRELEYRRHGSLPSHLNAESEPWASGPRFMSRSRHLARYLGRSPETWRRSLRRNTATAPPDTSQSTTPSTPPAPAESREQREPIRRASTNTVGGGSRGLPHRHQAVYANIRNAMLSHRISVPVVHVNGVPAPPVDNSPPPRPRPHSPPPYHLSANSPILTPRLLHPRYGGPSPFDDSTSEDSSPQDRSDYSLFMRGNNTSGNGSSSVILNDVSISPHHRIQAWDFSRFNIPDISSADKNIVVSECKIHNDASVDISHDGCLLVTLLPSGRLSITTMLGVYSLQWETLGQLLYTTSFEQNAVSVSLSPTTRHLVVGLASRRIPLINSDRFANAQVYRLEGATPGQKVLLRTRGRLVRIRDFELGRNYGMSLNCIRWAPSPGQGLVYGTNTGQLTILR